MTCLSAAELEYRVATLVASRYGTTVSTGPALLCPRLGRLAIAVRLAPETEHALHCFFFPSSARCRFRYSLDAEQSGQWRPARLRITAVANALIIGRAD
jgi:hypothetical protein